MGIPAGVSVAAKRLLALTWQLISHRAWSQAARYGGPPESYSGVLSSEPARRDETIRRLEADWQRLLRLELRQLTCPTAAALRQDCHHARSTPIRVMFCLFEVGKFRTDFTPARFWLRGLIDVLPDNKIVEEVHHGLKQDAKKTQSAKRSTARQQDVVAATPVFSSRRIPHTSAVSKEFFVRHFRKKTRT